MPNADQDAARPWPLRPTSRGLHSSTRKRLARLRRAAQRRTPHVFVCVMLGHDACPRRLRIESRITVHNRRQSRTLSAEGDEQQSNKENHLHRRSCPHRRRSTGAVGKEQRAKGCFNQCPQRKKERCHQPPVRGLSQLRKHAGQNGGRPKRRLDSGSVACPKTTTTRDSAIPLYNPLTSAATRRLHESDGRRAP